MNVNRNTSTKIIAYSYIFKKFGIIEGELFNQIHDKFTTKHNN
ncbi:MAG TPA: hypothetical protein VNR61_10390 [Niallia sp.]|nr:hypothetical protein [Niallia sp.]